MECGRMECGRMECGRIVGGWSVGVWSVGNWGVGNWGVKGWSVVEKWGKCGKMEREKKVERWYVGRVRNDGVREDGDG